MNVKIISIQGKASHPKRISRLNTDSEFHSPLSVQTRQSNCSSRNKNGYHINFFNKDKAQRFFNFNSKANASKVQKRNRTPSKIGSQDNNKPMALPVAIRITNVFDCKKKSKSKQSFLSPAKTDLSLRRKTTIQEKRINFPLRNYDSRIDSKKHSKISSHLGMGNILYTTTTKVKVTPKNNDRVKREDAKEKERNETSIKKKKLSLLDSNDNTLYANEIPDGIRKKMIVYYQAGPIDYRNDKPSEDKAGYNEKSNKEQQHQRCNMLSNTEGNKATVRLNVNMNVNPESKQEMKETQIRLVNNNNDYSHNSHRNSHNSHNSNAMSSSTPTISVNDNNNTNNNRIASKNKYRDLICQYLSEEVEENDKNEAYIF